MAQDELHFGMVKFIKNGEKHEVSWKKKFSIDSQKKSIPYTVWLFKVANWKITILDR